MFRGYRVKAVDSFIMEDYCVMVTASNDGFIKMWKLHLKEVRLMPSTTWFSELAMLWGA